MDITEFWAVIDAARLAAASVPGGPREAVATALTDRLAATSKQTILEYQERFDQLHNALYRWDVWAAAYLIGGGCSDDSFMDFRAGLIAQRVPTTRTPAGPTDMGEDFDFDDPAQMHARLPRLAALLTVCT